LIKGTLVLTLATLVAVWQTSPRTALAQQNTPLPPELLGIELELITLQQAGTAAEDTTGLGMTLLFEAEDRANGSGGCNRFMTGYTVGDAQRLTFDPIASSLRLCGEPADGREQRYLATLEAVTAYNLATDRLRLTTDDGSELVYAVPSPTAAVPAAPPTQLPQTGDDRLPPSVALGALASLALGSIALGFCLRRRAATR
jgi:LPXTG-motif cell wall-anchored protein